MEGEQALELRLDQCLVVGEDEPRARQALAQLGRVGDRAGGALRVVGRLAVGDVEGVGRLPRVEALDGRVRVGPAERHVDRVVRVERPDLPALRIQEPLAERVQVRLELGLDPVDQPLHELGLRLRRPAGPAVGLVGLIGGRALVVVAPVLVEVAVWIDAVADVDLIVVVVVAQVLAPQPLVVECVLVAVGVGDDHEPELGPLEHPPDRPVVGPPAADEVIQGAPVHLGADPLARVLG